MSLAVRVLASGDEAANGWGCGRCGREDTKADEGGDLADETRNRWLRNCDAETNVNVAWAWAPELRRCPWSQVSPMAWALVDVWRQWRDYRETPWGTVFQAPNPVAEAIEACESAVESVTQWRHNTEAREAERAADRARRKVGRHG